MKQLLYKKLIEKIAVGIMCFIFLLFAFIFIFFIGIILWKGKEALSFNFMTQIPSNGMTGGGILPAIIGTIMVAFVSTLFSIPFGVISGIYLSEYLKQGRLSRYIQLIIKNLAGVPSVVYGLFGTALFLNTFHLKKSVLAAGLTLGILTLPIVIISTMESIKAVPFSLRQASLGLGGNQWQTISKVVVPMGFPGILTGCLLAITRAVGETAPLIFTGVAYYIAAPRYAFDSQFMSLSFHIFSLTVQHPELKKVMPIAYGAAFILLGLVFILSLFTVFIRYKYQRKK